MNSFFSRHAVDKHSTAWQRGNSKAEQAWLGWGGDPGWRWVKSILAKQSSKTKETYIQASGAPPNWAASPDRPIGVDQTPHTGAMVAFTLPDNIAQALAIPGYERPSDLHLTLAFLGDTRELEAQTALIHQMAQTACQQFSRQADTVKGVVSGIGLFNIPGDRNAFYASFDSTTIQEFRAALVNSLADAGLIVNGEHGFTPHITLAYLDKGQALPVQDVPMIPIEFGWISLYWGDVVDTWALGQSHIEPTRWRQFEGMPDTFKEAFEALEGVASKAANYGAKAGQTINGHLMRGKDGKFSSGGNLTDDQKAQRAGDVKMVQAKGGGHYTPPKQPKGKGGKGKGKAGAKGKVPKKTPEQIQAEKDKNFTNVLAQTVKDPGLTDALGDLGNYTDAELKDGMQQKSLDALEKAGMVTKNADGSYTKTPAFNEFTKAAEAGDNGKAADALARATESVSNRAAKTQAAANAKTQRQQAHDAKQAAAEQKRTAHQQAAEQKRQAAAAVRQQKQAARLAAQQAKLAQKKAKPPKGGGGGGGGAAKPTKTPDQQKAEQAKNLGDTLDKTLGSDLAEALTVGNFPGDLSGIDPGFGDQLVERGLATKNQDNSYGLNGDGNALIRAGQKGDQALAQKIVQSAQQKARNKQAQQKTLDQKRQTVDQARQQRLADRQARIEQRQQQLDQRNSAGGKLSTRQKLQQQQDRINLEREQASHATKEVLTAKRRDDLKPSQFVFSDERKFPVTNRAGIQQAVHSWGRYRGRHSFEDFQRNLTRLARRNGWESSLPTNWQEATKSKLVTKETEAQTGQAFKEVQTEPDGMVTVFKDANGRWRWLTITSSAFKDRDREIIPTAALQQDCDRCDLTGQYGPLRWWHVPGLELGDCDFNAMHGRLEIESGTFHNEAFGDVLAQNGADLAVSRGYRYPLDKFDDQTYQEVYKFERSLLPADKASNLLATFELLSAA